jgi:hypothetical protein
MGEPGPQLNDGRNNQFHWLEYGPMDAPVQRSMILCGRNAALS